MPTDPSPRDNNNVPALAGEDSTDSSKTAVVAVNPATGGIIVELV